MPYTLNFKSTVNNLIGLSFFGLVTAIALPAAAHSPLEGTWYNSYCSRMDINVNADSGEISGVYTSHTGSTGTAVLTGYVDPNAVADQSEKPEGIPVSIGIQWRLINVDVPDNSWHWVSAYAGQYHPAQTVRAGGQYDYQIPETIEILNGLYASATLSQLAETAPVMLPQTLRFTRNAEAYCQSVEPAKPVEYKPTADDNVSGIWISEDGKIELELIADRDTGSVHGTAIIENNRGFVVKGLFDTLKPENTAEVPEQALSLAVYDENSNELYNMTGGVFYNNSEEMELWIGKLEKTTWTNRFIQQALDKQLFMKAHRD